MGWRSAFGIAAICLLSAASSMAADPRAAQVSAALPTEVSGFEKSSDDIADVSGTPPALTVLRFLAGSVGLAQIQVRIWTVADTAADAEIMLDPETLRMFEGKQVEIAGHKGAFVNGVLVIYPGLPSSAVTVTIGGLKDGDVLTAIAEKVDYAALLAIP